MAGFIFIHGITHKQISFVSSWGTLKQVKMCIKLLSGGIMIIDLYSDYSTYGFGRGTIPINMAYVGCRGTESTLAECAYTSQQSSCYNGIIGVHCSDQSSNNITRQIFTN